MGIVNSLREKFQQPRTIHGDVIEPVKFLPQPDNIYKPVQERIKDQRDKIMRNAGDEDLIDSASDWAEMTSHNWENRTNQQLAEDWELAHRAFAEGTVTKKQRDEMVRDVEEHPNWKIKDVSKK